MPAFGVLPPTELLTRSGSPAERLAEA